MQIKGLTLPRLCLAAASSFLLTAHSEHTAYASQPHRLQHGETLSAIARKYKVSIGDLKEANDLTNVDSVPDGRLLKIPSPPHKHFVEPTTHRRTAVNANQTSVRLGPDTNYRRVAYAFEGDKVVVTAQRDGWAQVTLANGTKGWINTDYLVHNSHSGETQTAHNSPAPEKSNHTTHHHTVVAAADERRRTHKVASQHVASATHPGKKHTQHQHEVKVAKVERHTHHTRHSEPTQTASSHHHHKASEQQVASSRSHHRHSFSAKHTVVASSHRHHSAHSSEIKVATVHFSPKHSVPEADRPAPANELVRTAYSYRGTPYRWGGDRPGGFDCSGLTMHLMGKKGVSLPHSASSQFSMGHHIDKASMKPGDLVFFHTVNPGIGHVGMYVGKGKFVHASSRRSGGVRVDSIDSGYYSKAFRGARRMKP